MDEQTERTVAALRRERRDMEVHGKTARMAAIDEELRKLGVDVPQATEPTAPTRPKRQTR